MRRFVLLAAVVACVFAPAAHADGLPVLGVDVGSSGVTVHGDADRYVTVTQSGATLVERIQRNGGRVLGLNRIPGNFTIPAVAYDGSASGLSADGQTLVLIEPRVAFPRQQTRFALLDARTLRLEHEIVLRGDFSFDAVSPRGKTMFLVNYVSPSDPTRYSVRAYDLRTSTLVPGDIRDPAERDEAMRGSPITRLMSADGHWAYTLYDGAGGTPFVHALDTTTLRAHCIDLPMLAGRSDLWSLRFTLAGNRVLRVGNLGTALANVDLTTFAAHVPVTSRPSRLRPWLLLAGALVAIVTALATAALLARRRVRGRLAAA